MPLRDDEFKRAVKEALKEWLDEKYLAFGRWSFFAISSAAFVALLYFILKMNHWAIVDSTIVR